MEKFYIGAETLFFKEGHPYQADANNKMELIYRGYGAFKQSPTTEELKCLQESYVVFGFDESIGKYAFGLEDFDNFKPVECVSIKECEGFYHRTIEPWYSDKHHPLLLFLGDVFVYQIVEVDGSEFIKGVHTLREWSV